MPTRWPKRPKDSGLASAVGAEGFVTRGHGRFLFSHLFSFFYLSSVSQSMAQDDGTVHAGFFSWTANYIIDIFLFFSFLLPFFFLPGLFWAHEGQVIMSEEVYMTIPCSTRKLRTRIMKKKKATYLPIFSGYVFLRDRFRPSQWDFHALSD